jgi:hypothetical protein
MMIVLMALAVSLPDPQFDDAVRAAPRQVRAFLERREECDHWAGEEPYDKARARQIDRASRRLRCGRIEADEQAIRRAYASRSDLIHLLDATADPVD